MSLKRQRIDVQDAPNVTNEQKKRRGKKKEEDVVLDDVDNSLESDEVIAEDEEEGNFDDEMAIHDALDSDESEQDDFQDVKSKKRKKQSKDPASFATAMSALLSSSLKAHTRSDPILARSKSHSRSLESSKAEHRIRKALSTQRKAVRSIGHVEDLSTYDAKDIEYERSMKKAAQRGVVKLFNAIRASQIKAEQALSQVKGVSRGVKEQQIKEMSREGFLNLIKSG